jgi:hypothetical protein
MHLEIRYLVTILSAILIFGGLYFKFLYDVPDGEDITNMWVSWFLIIIGVIGIMVSALWKKRNPLQVVGDDDSEEDKYVSDNDVRSRNIRSKNTSSKIGDRDDDHAGLMDGNQ